MRFSVNLTSHNSTDLKPNATHTSVAFITTKIMAGTPDATPLGPGNEPIPVRLTQSRLSNEAIIAIVFGVCVVGIPWLIYLLTRGSNKETESIELEEVGGDP